jgi:hypothetical protein
MTVPSPPALSQAITDLYAAFARYRVTSLEGCPDCTSPAAGAALLARPLRDRSPADLARYAFKALTPWGTVDDFKHFLPRLLDLLAHTGGRDWIDPEVVFGKLPHGRWTTWPRRERAALLAFFDALWNDILSLHPHPFEIDRCLCGIALAVDDLTPYLTAWHRATDAPAFRQFAHFLDHNLPRGANRRRRYRLANPWWDERPHQARQVETWLLDPARDTWLAAAMNRLGDDPDLAALLAEAMAHLAAIREALSNRPV